MFCWRAVGVAAWTAWQNSAGVGDSTQPLQLEASRCQTVGLSSGSTSLGTVRKMRRSRSVGGASGKASGGEQIALDELRLGYAQYFDPGAIDFAGAVCSTRVCHGPGLRYTNSRQTGVGAGASLAMSVGRPLAKR